MPLKFTIQAPILKYKTQENTVVFFSYGTFVQNCKLVFKKGYSIALLDYINLLTLDEGFSKTATRDIKDDKEPLEVK